MHNLAEHAYNAFIAKNTLGTATLIDFGLNLTGTDRFGASVLASNGKIYVAPYKGTAILEIDPQSDTASFKTYGLTIASNDHYGIVEGSDGKLYLPPLEGDMFTVIDVAANTAIRTNFGLNFPSAQRPYYIDAVRLGNFLVFVPIGGGVRELLLLNTLSGNSGAIPIPPTVYNNAVDPAFLKATVTPEGLVYLTPSNTKGYLVVNVAARKAGWVDGYVGNWGARPIAGGCLGCDGYIYSAPATLDRTLRRMNPVTNQANDIQVPITGEFGGTVLTGDGRVALLPNTATQIVIYNPTINAFVSSDYGLTGLGTTHSFLSGVVSPAGHLYAPPTKGGKFLRLTKAT